MQSEDISSKEKMAKGESEMNAAIGFSKPSYMRLKTRAIGLHVGTLNTSFKKY